MLIIFDQLTKYLVTARIALHESVPVLNGFIYFTRVHNTGIAFGLFRGMVLIFVFTSVLVILLTVLWVRRLRTGHTALRTGLLLILSGTIGNLLDRIRFGYVIDFIDLKVWPVFNVADAAITVGGAFLIGYIFLLTQKNRRVNNASYII